MGSEENQWYGQAFDDYCSRNDRAQVVISVIQNQLHGHKLGEARSLLSIGPGFGVIDSTILGSMMPLCTHFYAVEPDQFSVKRLRTNLKQKCPHVEVDISCAGVEDWAGPPQRVDIIWLLDVLYYVRDRPTFLKKCLTEYLNPGGQIFVVLDGELGISSNLAKHRGEFNEGHGYIHQNFLEELKELDAETTVVASARFEFSTDVSKVTEQMATFHLQRPVTSCEVAEVSEFMKATFPSGVAAEYEWITIVTPHDA